MALKNYNNNDKNITNTTYSSIAFSNPDSKIMQSRFSISYFNRLMKISIALRNNAGSNDAYATFDTDNQVSVYVSATKAHILHMMIEKFKHGVSSDGEEINNVCIELKNGLLKIFKNYTTNTICFSISYADETGRVNEVIYETKGPDIYTAAYNYEDGKFSTESFNDIELEYFDMALEEYYKASSYAIAATVMEASMYKRDSQYQLIKQIADKVGVSTSSGKAFNNKTFLSNNNSNSKPSFSNGSISSDIPNEYETTTFDSIAESM